MSDHDLTTGEVDEINLATLADGACIEQVNDALKAAWRNICDPNTKAGDTRQVVLTLKLQPNDDRTQVIASFRVAQKFASDKPGMAIVELCRARGGEIIATELRSRQMDLRGTETETAANITPLRREEIR